MRGDSVYGVKSYNKVLVPIAKNLKIHRRQFPQTLFYMKLNIVLMHTNCSKILLKIFMKGRIKPYQIV